MKNFEPISFNYSLCEFEVAEFEHLLETKSILKENEDILPFFREHKQIAALCGVLSRAIDKPDLVAWEFDLFGDFTCDVVVAHSTKKAFCFIEFEDANPKSLFVRKGKKATREWSVRLDHGCSQIIDWFYKITKMSEHPDFEARFDKRTIDFAGGASNRSTKGLQRSIGILPLRVAERPRCSGIKTYSVCHI